MLSMAFLLVLSCFALSWGLPAHPASTNEHLTSQHDSARKMWNAAKMAYKSNKRLLTHTPKRTRRQASAPPAPSGLNVNAPKYIVDLYNNLTHNSTSEVDADAVATANTIRSAPYSPPGEYAARFFALCNSSAAGELNHQLASCSKMLGAKIFNILFSLSCLIAQPKCGEFNFSTAAFNVSSEFLIKAEIRLWLNIHYPSDASDYIIGIKPEYPDGRESRVLRKPLEVGDHDQYVVFDVTDELDRNLELGSK